MNMFGYTPTPLLIHLTTLLDQQNLLKKLLVVNFLNVAFELLSCWMLFKISVGNIELIYPYVCLDIFHTFIDATYIRSVNTDIAYSMRREFKIKAIKQYKDLSFESKNKALADTFYSKMIQASESYYQLVSWGVPTIFGLVTSFIQCLIIFYYKGLFVPLCLIICINLISYYQYIKDKQKDFSDSNKKTRESNDKVRSLVNLYLPLYQHDEKPPEYIMALTDRIDKSWYNIDNKWKHIMIVTKIVNKSGIILISSSLNDSITGFLLLVKTFGNFNGSISGLTAFLNNNNRYETNYDTYLQFFKDLTYQNKPVQNDLPKSLTIVSININRGGFNMAFGETIKTLTINMGDKILIKGKTGDGKSTFINALMGKINGITLGSGNASTCIPRTDDAKPENYFHAYVDMYQNIREKLPSSSISIREIFDDDLDDALIIGCLKPCFPDGELDRFLSVLSKKKSSGFADKTDSLLSEELNPLDSNISERISGGQKTRLALATRIYQMITKPGKQILILDEPEQGSDPEVAIKVIGNIFELFKDKTIIMISHICNCQLNALNIEWNHKLSICRGIIDKY